MEKLWNGKRIEMELSFVVMVDYFFIYYSFFNGLKSLSSSQNLPQINSDQTILLCIQILIRLTKISAMIRANRGCNENVLCFVVFVSFFFSFSFYSRHVSACLVRTTESVFPFTKQTATFVPARKYSQENAAKTVRKRLKRLLGALAGTTRRTHLKV